MMNLKQLFLKNRETIKRYVIYCIIGFSGMIVDFALFNIGIKLLKFSIPMSNILSMSVGITVNFLLNAFLNFKRKDKILYRWALFMLIGGLGIIISNFIISMITLNFGWGPNIAKLISIPIIATIQFVLHKLITFRE